MKFLCAFLLSFAAWSQVDPLAKALDIPKVTAPPVIVLTPAGENTTATLLATRDLPPGTNVVATVKTAQGPEVYPTFQISTPGTYGLATLPPGAEISVFVTTPTGHPFLLGSRPVLRGYSYSGGVLTVYGSFGSAPAFVYVGNGLTPLVATGKGDRLEVPLKPADGVTTITVYQAGGLCDSIGVRLPRW